MSLLSHDLQSTMILNQWCFERKKQQQLLKKHGSSKAVQIITTQTVKSLACGLWNSQKVAEEKARGWANVEMVSCVADPHESEEKCGWCFTNKRRQSNWYLSEKGLLHATRATVIALIYKALFPQCLRSVLVSLCKLLLGDLDSATLDWKHYSETCIKRTPSIKQTVAEVPKFISVIYFKWNLY